MEKHKQFKDATQGYITIDENFVDYLIDTFEVQRLKDVAQTGIRPLFTGATHDRFSHSMGVYNLSKKVFSSFKSNVLNNISDVNNDKLKDDVSNFFDEFEPYLYVACILHDIGHPALSHTFEYLYDSDYMQFKPSEETISISKKEVERLIEKKANAQINKSRDSTILLLCLKDEFDLLNRQRNSKFPYEIDLESINAKQHEMMGALQLLTSRELKYDIGAVLAKGQSSMDSVDYGFIAMMIVGGRYLETGREKTIASLRNCFIQILNGKIDVDSIDYLCRNSHFAGYTTTEPDVVRLTDAFSAIYDEKKGVFSFCLEKTSLSVLEGFISARNYEPKWLYSHHKVVYYSEFLVKYLYKRCARLLFAQDQDKWEIIISRLFFENLSKKPVPVGDCLLKTIHDDIKSILSETCSAIEIDNADFNKELESYRSLSFLLLGLLINREKVIPDDKLPSILERIYSVYYEEISPEEIANLIGEEYGVLLDLDSIKKWISFHSGFTSFSEPSSCFSLKAITFIVLKSINSVNLSEFETDDNCATQVKMLTDALLQYNELIGIIRNAYLDYIISPISKFIRGEKSTAFFKSTDSDIASLFKQMYLTYENAKYSNLSPAEKNAIPESEYPLFSQILSEFHTRKYRKSLWKTNEEYMLFLSGISKKTGKKLKELNDQFLIMIREKYQPVDFEDVRLIKTEMLKNENHNVFFYLNYNRNRNDEVFSEFKNGLIVIIHKLRFKDFCDINMNFRSKLFTGKGVNGLIKCKKIYGLKTASNQEYPYIYYNENEENRIYYLNALQQRLISYFSEKT